MLRAKQGQRLDNALTGLEVIATSLPGHCEASLPAAAARSGAIGLLNLVHHRDATSAASAAHELARLQSARVGLVIRSNLGDTELAALAAIGQAELILLTCEPDTELAPAIERARQHTHRVGVVVTSRLEAQAAVTAGCDLLVAKGHESGGFVGEETSFVLVQSLISTFDMPLYVWGGISWNTAAACAAVGCAGVVLDWQLALLRESPLGNALRRRLAQMDGSEVATQVCGPGRSLRFYHQPGMGARAQLEELAVASRQSNEPVDWNEAVSKLIDARRERDRLILAGQDAAFASDWARQAPSVGRALRLLESRVSAQVRAADNARVLDADGPLAASHGTRFPVVQGPMTRVSDVPEFCRDVAVEGGLPFLALALMGETQVRSLLERTKAMLGDRPWGVGVLGFVPQEIRSQQWPVIRDVCPPFAVIAGGRPDQAASLEEKGIVTYLHVPSPGMLDIFVREGARRFVFEGRECGGHVGPRTSFVLWEAMIRVLTEADLSPEEAAKVHVLFAGGIHDRQGAAMVSVLAQPLVDRGMKVGVLLGTAYLFTHEIVASGALVEGFQSVALAADRTVVVESGPGHAIRCAETAYVDLFESEKRRLEAAQLPQEEQRLELENLNLGRLRIASKGVTRAERQPELIKIDEPTQRQQGMYMIGQVAALRNKVCSIRELHEEVCLGAVEALHRAAATEILPTAKVISPKPLDIAIVGLACMVPGATDASRLWHNVLTKFNPITEVPADRFEVDRWFDGDRKARDKIYGKWGGFVADLPFDPLKYGIPPASIKSIEPMQLLAMELVDRALNDAGYGKHNPSRDRTSVVLGVGGGAGELGANYAFRAMLPRFLDNPNESVWEQLPEWTEDSFAGILFNVVAGRVTNRFDFGGVNCTIDAACASSLAALYWSCHELASGQCDMAISGGCDTMQNPFGYLCFAKAGALSPRGLARVFDADSDGIVISEGHAAVVLKRREDAERDGDKIYALIRAVSSGSDGRSKGLTAPRMEGQLRTLQRAYDQAGVNPTTVRLFEAHGTGTAVGDQTEGMALTTFLSEAGAAPQSVAVGSIKSMIGHTKCAAGAVGLVKTVMALQHRVLPPTMHVERPNPKAGLVDGPLFVNTEARPWLESDGPRRAGVSSFGFGGTNFHVLLEEYDRGQQARPLALRRDRAQELFVLAADSPASLRMSAKSLANEATALQKNNIESAFARFAYTHYLRSQRLDKPCRAAFVASSLDDLQKTLLAFEQAVNDQGEVTGKLPSGAYYTPRPQSPGEVAFLFPGQGSQHPGMLQELAVEYSEVAECLQRADDALLPELGDRLSRFIFPATAFTDDQRSRAVEELKATRVAQPALGACGQAMFRLLEAFGVRASMHGGHSFGELVALSAAGAISEQQLFHLAAARGRAMSATGDVPRGAMLAVSAGVDAVRAQLAGLDGVWIANLNSPSQTVLSGTEAGIAAALAEFNAAGISARQLPVSAAFHSPFMNRPREAFSKVLADVEFGVPEARVYSNVAASAYDGSAGQFQQLLAEQLTSEVRFVEQIEAMYRDGARIFVEVGPKGVLTGLVRDILRERPHVAIATQPSADESPKRFLAALAQLVVHGVELSLDRLYDNRGLETLDRGVLAGKPAAALGSHIWLVNGAYARKVGEPLRNTAPRARLAEIHEPSGVPMAQTGELRPHREETVASSKPLHELHPPHANGSHAHPVPSHGHLTNDVAPSSAPVSPPLESRPAANPPVSASDQPASQLVGGTMSSSDYALFQGTMRQFLETQETVLRHLFGGGAGQANIAAQTQPQHQPVVAAVSLQAVPLQAVPIEAETIEPLHGVQQEVPVPPAASPVASAPIVPAAAVPSEIQARSVASVAVEPATSAAHSLESLTARLTNIVADRTGYPAEMLDVDINLEGELGIDSIKRVEIIAAFRRDVFPAMQEPPAEFMEKLASAKSMRRIVEVVAEMAGPSTPSTTTASAPVRAAAPAAGNSLDADDLLTTLLRIVADRTGYPAEMLDLDIHLESELGIDSIKRVEIIAAFRREVLPDLLEPPAEFMERLSSAKTMRAIIAVIISMAGGIAKPSEPAPVAAAAESHPTLDAESLRATLLRIVADRTGYPSEMLELDINLESDLGIDSIKRVEIIAAFRREVRPDLIEPPADLMERLSAAKTMRAIIDCLAAKPAGVNHAEPIARAQTNGSATHASPKPATKVAETDSRPLPADECPRCVAEPVELPVVHLNKLSAGAVIVSADVHGVANHWAEQLRAAGHPVVQLGHAELSDREATRRAVDVVRREFGGIAAVAHLLPLDACAAWPEISPASWNERFALEVKGLLYLLQAIEPELARSQGPSIRVLCASIGGGDFALDADSLFSTRESTHPWRGGLSGLLKVAACEWANHAFRCVDFTELPRIDCLDQELLASGPVEIAYRHGRRLMVETRRVELNSPSHASSAHLTADHVVLVTGGAKGITAQIVAELAARTPARFILLGRSRFPEQDESSATASIDKDSALRPVIISQLRASGAACTPARVEAELSRIKSDREMRRSLAEIAKSGATVEYVCCDARDADSLARTIDAIRAKHGTIHGLIHGAGIIDDRAIKDKTAESFDRVVGTKIDPLLTLLGKLDLNELKLVVLFGSTSGIFGNSGQGDYAAANEILNRVARRLRSTWNGKVVTLNWGPWAGAGMVTPEVAEKMRTQGVDLISVAGGRAAACREIFASASDNPRVVLGRGPWLDSERLRSGSLDLSSSGPLLSGHSVEVKDGRVVARMKLDPRTQYLQDHCIEGKAVLPVAVAVGFMAEAAHRAQPDWHVAAVENVRMLSGITVDSVGREIIVTAEPTARDEQTGRWRVKITGADLPQRSLYDADVVLAATLPTAPAFPGPAAIQIPLAASASEAYDRWLFHGPMYQVIEGFTGADERGIDAIVRSGGTPKVGDIQLPWVIDPVVVDAAPQLAMIWSRALYDVAVLPSRISSYRVYEPIGDGNVEMMLRVRPGQDRQVYHADVWIVREGRIVAHMEGLEGAGGPHLNRIAVSGAL